MFTIYCTSSARQDDAHRDLASLDEALRLLRDLIASDLVDPDGPASIRYGLSFGDGPATEQPRALAVTSPASSPYSESAASAMAASMTAVA